MLTRLVLTTPVPDELAAHAVGEHFLALFTLDLQRILAVDAVMDSWELCVKMLDDPRPQIIMRLDCPRAPQPKHTRKDLELNLWQFLVNVGRILVRNTGANNGIAQSDFLGLCSWSRCVTGCGTIIT